MPEVQHLENENIFVIPVGEERAHLKYRIEGTNTIEYYSTFVPDAARGQGLAKVLVEAGISYAREKNFKIKPTCSYVDKYIDRHAELHKLRV